MSMPTWAKSHWKSVLCAMFAGAPVLVAEPDLVYSSSTEVSFLRVRRRMNIEFGILNNINFTKISFKKSSKSSKKNPQNPQNPQKSSESSKKNPQNPQNPQKKILKKKSSNSNPQNPQNPQPSSTILKNPQNVWDF